MLKIDQHNRFRQEILDIEKKVDTSGCVNLSIFSMCVVDAYLIRKGIR